AHIAGAARESSGLQAAEVVDAIGDDWGLERNELRVDGGACRNNLLMQIQADLAGVRILRSAVSETTALGAAYLAGLKAEWKADRIFEPRADCSALREQWQVALGRLTA